MRVLTAEQMSYLDSKTIEKGKSGLSLMREAGAKFFEFIEENIGIRTNVTVIAGKGNNGGDGFRVAELMSLNGYGIRVFLLGEKKQVRGDALTCMTSLEKTGIEVIEIHSPEKTGYALEIIDKSELIIDAIFGTGFKGETEGIIASIIDAVDSSDAIVVSVDIPSGVNSSTGEAAKTAVDADYTISFGCLKAGHVLMPGRKKSGIVKIAEIGFSEEVLNTIIPFGNSLTDNEAAFLVPERSYDSYKGSAGRVLIIAGSVGMTGAGYLTSLASMRAGAGVAVLGCPESLNDIMEAKLTEVMTLPLPEVSKKRCLSLRSLGMLREKAKNFDVVAIGPGLGNYHETSELIRRFVASYKGKIVLDADGINAFEGKIGLINDSPAEMILTPHYGELSKLTGFKIENIKADPITFCKKASEISGKIVLLKGAPTFISSPDNELWINNSGNEGMATAGMGDVLTGTIAGLSSQKLKMLDAAVLGAYIHGKAGDIISARNGVHGLMSGDVLNSIPEAIRYIIC
jgi:ADP-dependent NAD(P)H-hydrate dehydratase / NAD(P)H-hydrate epimerase